MPGYALIMSSSPAPALKRAIPGSALARVCWSCGQAAHRRPFIARRNGYHGSTVAGATHGRHQATCMSRATCRSQVSSISASPNWYADGGDLSPEAFGLKVARELEEKIDELGEDNVAAFIAEPVQGAGGVIIHLRPIGRNRPHLQGEVDRLAGWTKQGVVSERRDRRTDHEIELGLVIGKRGGSISRRPTRSAMWRATRSPST